MSSKKTSGEQPASTEQEAPNTAPAQADKAATSFPMTLDEFCARLSQSDRRVELIGAFHFDEKRNKRVKDTEANFRARFDAFINKPVA